MTRIPFQTALGRFLLLALPNAYAQTSSTPPELFLPFPEGAKHRCSQSIQGQSHKGKDQYALDFALPRSKAVSAAAGGVAYVFPQVTLGLKCLFGTRDLASCETDSDCPGPGSAGCKDGGYGNYIAIDHGNSWFTVYAHLQEFEPNIHGAVVTSGQIIGKSNNTGRSEADHLHFALHFGNASSGVPGSQSKLIPRILLRDATTNSRIFWTTGDLVCGALGSGHFYQSVRPKTLTVSKVGNGSGRVRSDPTNIDCGPNCLSASADFVAGTNVKLFAEPATGSVFGGWGGECADRVTPTVIFIGQSLLHCSATFRTQSFPLTLTLAPDEFGTGSATVISSPAGIHCTLVEGAPARTCSAAFPRGTNVTLAISLSPRLPPYYTGSKVTEMSAACQNGTIQMSASRTCVIKLTSQD